MRCQNHDDIQRPLGSKQRPSGVNENEERQTKRSVLLLVKRTSVERKKKAAL